MCLRQIIRKIVSLLFPGYAAKRARKEKAGILSLEQHLFPEEKIKAVFPHLKARRHTESGKWVLRVNGRTDVYLLLNALPGIGRAVMKSKPDRILTTVPVNRKSSLILVEYLFPSRTKLEMSGKEEVLFARAFVRNGDHTKSVLDFYMNIHRASRCKLSANRLFVQNYCCL